MTNGISMSTDNNRKTIAFIIGNLFLIIGGFSYFTGWTYIYYLYNKFGISLNIIDPPLYYIIRYSYDIFINKYSLVLISIVIAIIMSLVFFSQKYKLQKLQKLQKHQYKIFLIIIILLIPIYSFLAKTFAHDEAKKIISGEDGKVIIFTFKDNLKKSYPPDFLEANENYKLIPITQTKDRFFVFFRFESKDRKDIIINYVIDIPRSDVLLAKIIIQETNDAKKGGHK